MKYLQPELPGSDEKPSWLPSPTDGEWFVILPMYRPRAEVIDGDLEMPADRTGRLRPR